MSMTEAEVAAAAEHALGLDEGAARAAARRRAAVDPDFRAEIADWEATLATFWQDVPEVAPPARVWRRLRARLFGRPARPLARLAPWVLTGLAAAALAAVLLIPIAPRDASAPGALIAEIATEDDGLRVLAAYDPAAGAFRVRRLSGAPPEGRDLEFWAIAPDGVPVSLGVIGARTLAVLPEALRGEVRDLTLAVSEEDRGGSATGAPTNVLAAAPVVDL